MKIQVVADDTDREGGYVVERLVQLGGEVEWLDRDDLPAGPGDDTALLLLLGSVRSAHEAREALVVEAEEQLVRATLGSHVPVMAICYGAQIVARALGGTSYRAGEPEVGWRRVDTLDEVLCPEGPWAQFHEDVFAPPPTSRVLGSSWYGPQCFVDDEFGAPVIAWQFHPEVTPETFTRWVETSSGLVRASGADPVQLVRQGLSQAARARSAAHRLVDAALDHLGVALPEGAAAE